MSKPANKTYSQILQSIGIFGSGQLLNLCIGVLKNKITAVILGGVGIGFISIYQSIIDLIKSIASFGIETSGVREIASTTNNIKSLNFTISFVLRLSLALALLGALLCLLLSYPISRWAFSSYSYVPQVSLLAICVFFSIMAAGESVVLQGLQKISFLVKSSLIWNFGGLVVAIPLYYMFGITAIIPVLIIVSILMYLSALFYRKRLTKQCEKITFKLSFIKGKTMLRVGFYILLSVVQTQISYFILKTLVIHKLNLEALGFMQAAITISNVYLLLITKSLGTDFYPRLSKVSTYNSKIRKLTNEEIDIVLLISLPAVAFLLIFSSVILKIMYLESFQLATPLLNWFSLGLFFKILSWIFSFVFLAKNKGLIFFLSDLLFSLIYLTLAYYLFDQFSLKSIGVSYTIAYFIYFLLMFLLNNKLFNFKWSFRNIKLGSVSFFLIVLIFTIVEYLPSFKFYLGLPIAAASTIYSIYVLNKIVNLKTIFPFLKKK